MQLAVADRLSGWVEVFSSPSKSIHFSATGLLEQLRRSFKVFGVPVELAKRWRTPVQGVKHREVSVKVGSETPHLIRVFSAIERQSRGGSQNRETPSS